MSSESQACAINNSVDHQMVVRASDGCPLYVNLQGESGDLPVLLFLHGGPGGCLNPPIFRALLGRELERRYQVAYFYQRLVIERDEIPYESARRLWPDDDVQYEYTIDRHVQDIRRVIEELCSVTGQNQIILVGHSWGAHIGFRYLYQYRGDDGVSHFVAVAPSINAIENQRISYAKLLKEARNQGRNDIETFLLHHGCPPYDNVIDILQMMRYSEEVFGAFAAVPNETLIERTEFDQIPDEKWVNRRLQLSSRIWDEIKLADITGMLPLIEKPMLMAVGEIDYFVPPMAVEIGFDIYGGPKEKAMFPGTKHLVYHGCEAAFLDKLYRFLVK